MSNLCPYGIAYHRVLGMVQGPRSGLDRRALEVVDGIRVNPDASKVVFFFFFFFTLQPRVE